MREVMTEIILIIIALALLFGGAMAIGHAVCVAKTAEIGFASKWSILGDCRVEVQPGQWIPLDSYYFKQE